MSFEDALGVFGLGYYERKVAAVLATGKSYAEVFEKVPSSGSFHREGWPTIAKIHCFVVCYNPGSAWHWMDLALNPFLSGGEGVNHAYVQGTFLGLLQAGVLLDDLVIKRMLPEETAFQQTILKQLAKVVAGPMKLDFRITERNLEADNFSKEFVTAFRQFVFPDKDRAEKLPFRGLSMYDALNVIHACPDKEFDPMDKLFIDRLTMGFIGRAFPEDKVRLAKFLVESSSVS